MKTIRETFNAENWVDDKLTLVARVNADGSFRLNIKEWGGDNEVDAWFVSAPETVEGYTFQKVYSDRRQMEQWPNEPTAMLTNMAVGGGEFECYYYPTCEYTRFGSTPFEAVAKMKAHLG